MATEIKVPSLGESVSEATVAKWNKKVGDAVKADEPLVELETDKVTVEVPAPRDGVLTEIRANQDDEVEVGSLLGYVGTAAEAGASGGGGGGEAEAKAEKKEEPAPQKEEPAPKKEEAAPKKEEPAAKKEEPAPKKEEPADSGARTGSPDYSPAVRKLLDEHNLDPNQITGSGKDGRLTKADVEAHIRAQQKPAAEPAPSAAKTGASSEPSRESQAAAPPQAAAPARSAAEAASGERTEERVRMTKLRRRIAERLKESQNTAAMLSTFNEVDMSAVMDLRKRYRESFEKKHNVRLGFMSFFAKACTHVLKEIPEVNAQIEGSEIVYKNYYDMGIAVSTPQGLVVPVISDVDKISFAEFERTLTEKAKRGRDGTLTMEEMTGGTFTISNAGVYGSLMSMPILNPPQSGILGMHKIQERPVAVNGQVEIRPMMYLTLTYDHRLVDGREAVTFLVRLKELLEDPERLLLDL